MDHARHSVAPVVSPEAPERRKERDVVQMNLLTLRYPRSGPRSNPSHGDD